MKAHVLIFAVCSLIVSVSVGQPSKLTCKGIANKKLTVLTLSEQERVKIEEGEKISFISWRSSTDNDPIYGQSYSSEFVIEYNDDHYSMDMKEVKDVLFSDPENKKEFWDKFLIDNGVIQTLAENGIRYDLRGELDEEAIDYINLLDQNNLIYHDEYLEDYIQGLIFKIHPGGFNDKRPGNLNLLLINDSNPNAYSLPNGTIILTTGLLSIIDSEEELIGVLSHEIAHFVGDHHLNNILMAEKRAKRAEFWAGLATVAAGVADAYMAANNDYHVFGDLTYATAAISSNIAASMVERFGMQYSNMQEFQADEAAFDVMTFLNKKPEAYVTALTKIGNYYYRNGNYDALKHSHSHPSMESRLSQLEADASVFYDNDYQKLISFVNTHNAGIEYQKKHFTECEKLVDKNIDAGIATEDDFILKALVTRVLYNNDKSNNLALDYLLKAESLKIEPNAYIDKQKGITYLRLGQSNNARSSFEEYLNQLLDIYDDNSKAKTREEMKRLEKEISWTKRMIYKV